MQSQPGRKENKKQANIQSQRGRIQIIKLCKAVKKTKLDRIQKKNKARQELKQKVKQGKVGYDTTKGRQE